MIDFKKPIECDKGKVTLLAYDGNKVNVTLDGDMDYWVAHGTGNPLSVHLGLAGGFTVRNKKTVEELAYAAVKDEFSRSQPSTKLIVERLKKDGLLAED